MNSKQFYLTCIYGFNGREEREPLWAALQSISPHIGQVPWCVAGDFNAVMNKQDRLGAAIRWSEM
ncbi:Importin-8 [Bienertia sinuspersici]